MNRPRAVWLIQEPADQIAHQPAVRAALSELAAVLTGYGIALHPVESITPVPEGEACVVVASPESVPARALLDASRVSVPTVPEALALVPGRIENRPVLLACGSDARGLAYAVLELADRIIHAGDVADALTLASSVVEQPANPIRSIARLFTSDVEDKAWFYDREFWQRYLAMLIAQRFNRFSLTLGLGYNFPRRVRDAYLYFAYPFLLSVPGYDVRVPGLPDEERDRNLETLRFISEEAKARGLHFQLGLWTHAYEWIDSPDANYTIEGLTPDNHAAYCRDALRMLLESCPAIDGVTFRIHGESGVPEQSYEFWRTVFDGILRSGRRVEIDMHAKGIDQRMIDVALATGVPVNVSPKYWAEHMGLPYQQASIRELEHPPRDDRSEGFMALSGSSRRFLRYGYGDLLAEDRRFGVLYRIWPGTQRLLLWGDPAMAAGYGRYAHFCGCLGLEYCEPLSFKGRMGSGLSGNRDGYADSSLHPAGGDWEKHLYTYRLFGRLLYDPDADPETWRRSLRKELGAAAPAAEEALANASRVLPLVTTAHHPSASNNAYWPEIYTSIPIVDESRPHPYGDTPSPKRFGAVSSLDPELFARVDEFADELLAGQLSGRFSPVDVAWWLEGLSGAAERHLVEAEVRAADRGSPSFRRLAIDTALQSGLGRFFAAKLRAGVWYALFERTGEGSLLEQAITEYRAAREAWARLARQAESAYVPDLTFGLQPHLRGHWLDRLGAIDADLQDMESRRGTPARLGSADAASMSAARALLAELDSRDPRGWRCDHAPPAGFRRGEPLSIEVRIPRLGQRSLAVSARLHYRHVNQAETYQIAEMERQDGQFRSTISESYTDSPYPLQYFLTLHDERGGAWLYPGFEADLSNQPYFVIRSQEI